MATGRNSENAEDLKDSLLSYLSADHEHTELDALSKRPIEEIASMYDFEILHSAKPFPEDDY